MDGREGGYIRAHRQWESSPAVQALSAEGEVVWLRLLFATNWRDSTVILRTGQRTIKRGQALISEAELATRARVGRQVVRTALHTLTLSGAIVCEEVQPLANRRARLITVVNYDKFQAGEPEPTQGLTIGQPSVNPRPTQSEEGEEGEEGKKAAVQGGGSGVLDLAAEKWPLGERLRRELSARFSPMANGGRGIKPPATAQDREQLEADIRAAGYDAALADSVDYGHRRGAGASLRSIAFFLPRLHEFACRSPAATPQRVTAPASSPAKFTRSGQHAF